MAKKYLALVRVMESTINGTEVDVKAISSNSKADIDRWLDHYQSGEKKFYEKLTIENPSEDMLKFFNIFEILTRKTDGNFFLADEGNKESRGLYDACISC